MAFLSFLPRKNAVLPDLCFRWPGRYAPALRYTHKILRGRSELSIGQRELIGAYVSGLNSCQFCYSVHSTLAESFGVEEKLLESMLEDLEASELDTNLKPIFRYVKKVTETSSKIVQADIDAILAVGWKEKTVVDALSIAAAFAHWNRLMDGAGIPGIERETRMETTSFMRKMGYMPWFVAPIFAIWSWFRNPA